jgi:4-hydroxy-2-oxoheptanedioate aldolase
MERVPWLEPDAIMKALDAGAYGIICLMVNNARQATEFVTYIRYPRSGNAASVRLAFR